MDALTRARDLIARHVARMDAIGFDAELHRDVLAEIDAEIAAGGWRPIESAPHEVDVLLYCPPAGQSPACMEAGPASTGWRNEVASNMSFHGRATHWQPLPAPPKGDE